MDLNADIGEGFGPWSMGDDVGLLDVISSANIACGFHAGDARTMLELCLRAAERNIAVGAHVGYRDLHGFGRREIAITPEDLHAETLYQIGALETFAQRAGTRVSYVKPHGALYHAAGRDQELAEAVVRAMTEHTRRLTLLGPAGTHLESEARRAGLVFVSEGFADRAYGEDGLLVPRSVAGSVYVEVAPMIDQVRSLAVDRRVTTSSGRTRELVVDSICVHGDSASALDHARQIRAMLDAEGIPVSSFITH